ncbi:outer membrane protein [Bosea thiooxidans]|nr:outer membrane beta-barrel protein [Bosea sp. (in: a-proteobacteria)]
MRIRSMTRVAGAAALAALFGAPAFAADYPVLRGSQIEDAPPNPSLSTGPYNWTGFYFGGFGGLSQTRFRTDKGVLDIARGAFNGTSVLNDLDPGQLVLTSPRSDRGSTFGAFAGYNFAFGDAVIGFEAEYSRVDQSTSASTLEARQVSSGSMAIASVQDARLNDYINARIRLGYAYGMWMPYFTAGAAAGRFDTNIAVAAGWASSNGTNYYGWPRVLGGAKKDVWGYGYSIGGGLEAAVTDNLVIRGEYLFSSFNDVEGVTVNVNTARVGAAVKF